MKRLLLIVLVLTLTVACHRRGKEEMTDSVEKQDTIALVDTLQVMSADTATDEVSSQNTYTLQHDNAEITNLRIFARKQRVIYSPALLIGEWQCGTKHEEYCADGTGRMWDTAEDVGSDEAIRFEWSLDSNLLSIVCKMKMGGVVPKHYLVTFADEENLSYKNIYEEAYLWDKVIPSSK